MLYINASGTAVKYSLLFISIMATFIICSILIITLDLSILYLLILVYIREKHSNDIYLDDSDLTFKDWDESDF